MSNKTIWQINRHFFDVFLSIIHKIHMLKKLVVFPNWYDFTGEEVGGMGIGCILLSPVRRFRAFLFCRVQVWHAIGSACVSTTPCIKKAVSLWKHVGVVALSQFRKTPHA